MKNPLLAALPGTLIAFDQVRPEDVMPAITTLLQENRALLERLLSSEKGEKEYTWDNLMQPLEVADDRLDQVWSAVSHLHAVMHTDALREVYKQALSELNRYNTEVTHNVALYRAMESIAESKEFAALEPAQQKVVQNALRDFRLSGVHLPDQEKKHLAVLQEELAQEMARFEEHILDATQAWTYTVTDEKELAGLPETALRAARASAEERGQSGWVFTLEAPSYRAVMCYAKSRELRAKMHYAFLTRASDQGPHGGQWDNTAVMERILALRQSVANLLGFPHFTALSLVPKMAESEEQVSAFLQDLAQRCLPQARAEVLELREFARSIGFEGELAPWDIAYYSECLRKKRYAISQEDLRPYFPLESVLQGLFTIVERLYGCKIQAAEAPFWHKDISFYTILDEMGEVRGAFYWDVFTRTGKRSGAWMDECVVRRKREDGTIQHPVAFLTCNFSPPTSGHPALLTHDDVQTLFHEFGHGLHHVLTQVDYASVSGINGVPWDAVEFPSQFMEHWCWSREGVALISAHEATGAPLPDALFDKLTEARHFQAGLACLRQVMFSIFDHRLHTFLDSKDPGAIQAILDAVRLEFSVLPVAAYDRFQHSFSHIFAGGYAAGYYSYQWADVMASDAFALFEEQGILDRDTGQRFLACVLAQGGVEDPAVLFSRLRGRAPKIDALLRHLGISS